MPYEIGVLRPYLEKLFDPLKNNCEYFNTATEIINKVSVAETISSEFISEHSIYKEFV
jgi:hypothetical protein